MSNVADYLVEFVDAIRRRAAGTALAFHAIVEVKQRRTIPDDSDPSLIPQAIQILGHCATLLDKLEEELATVAPRRVGFYRPHLESIKFAICDCPPGRSTLEYVERFPSMSLDVLRMAGTELLQYPEIDHAELREIEESVWELIRQIQMSVTDPELQRWLLSLCRRMLRGVTDYSIFGAEAFSQAYTKVVGEMSAKGEHFGEKMRQAPEPVKSAFSKLWARFETIVRASDTSVKAIALSAAATAFVVGHAPLLGLPSPPPAPDPAKIVVVDHQAPEPNDEVVHQ